MGLEGLPAKEQPTYESLHLEESFPLHRLDPADAQFLKLIYEEGYEPHEAAEKAQIRGSHTYMGSRMYRTRLLQELKEYMDE